MVKVNLNKYFLYFMTYSFIGWIYEVFLEVVVYRWGFSNRGVLLGPYCVIYGVGALTFIFCLNKVMKYKKSSLFSLFKPLIIFISCALIATTLELIASYLLEFFTGSWPWQTYVDYQYNFQARIALSPSVRFGIGGVVFLYIIQPLLERLYSKPKYSTINKVAKILSLILIVDIILTLFVV